MKKFLVVTLQDFTDWAIPVSAIAYNRAKYYAKEFGENIEKSLNEDTLPSFEEDESVIINWANHCDWKEFSEYARQIGQILPKVDYSDWPNLPKKIRDIDMEDCFELEKKREKRLKEIQKLSEEYAVNDKTFVTIVKNNCDMNIISYWAYRIMKQFAKTWGDDELIKKYGRTITLAMMDWVKICVAG